MKKILTLLVDKIVHKKDMMKQVILVRTDLGMGTGKIAAQAAHASVEAVLASDMKDVRKWMGEGMKKVVLKVKSESELMKHATLARDAGLIVSLIVDAGWTEIKAGTKTSVAIGPAWEKDIDEVTGKLGLL